MSADDTWKIFDLSYLKKTLGGDPVEYLEFLKVPSMSCGIYRLEAGSKDMQGAHDEDEIYFVVEGKARLKTGNKEHIVSPGAVLYVSAGEEHCFFEIEEDRILLVFFAANAPGE